MRLDDSGNEVRDGQPLYLRAISQCKPPCHQVRERVALSRMETAEETEKQKRNGMGPVKAAGDQ